MRSAAGAPACLTWDGEVRDSQWMKNRLTAKQAKNEMLSDPCRARVRAPRGKSVTLQLSKDFLKIPLAAQEERWPISGSGINRLIKGILKNSFPVLKYISHWAVIRRKILSGPWLIFFYGLTEALVFWVVLCLDTVHRDSIPELETPVQVSHSLWWAAVSPSGGEGGEAREALRGHIAKRDESGVHILFPSNCNLEAKSKKQDLKCWEWWLEVGIGSPTGGRSGYLDDPVAEWTGEGGNQSSEKGRSFRTGGNLWTMSFSWASVLPDSGSLRMTLSWSHSAFPSSPPPPPSHTHHHHHGLSFLHMWVKMSFLLPGSVQYFLYK